MKCVDCEERVGIHPAVRRQDGSFGKRCQKCHNLATPFLHAKDCGCEHCRLWEGRPNAQDVVY